MIPSGPTLSVTVVDGKHGQAVQGLEVELEQQVNGVWQEAARSTTDSSGAISIRRNPTWASYRLKVNSSAYYATLGITPPLTNVVVTLWIPDTSRDYVILVIIDSHTQFTAILREDRPGDLPVEQAWRQGKALSATFPVLAARKPSTIIQLAGGAVPPSPCALVIETDGGTFDIIDPLLRQGLLPQLEHLLRLSASGDTESTWPAHTAPGWSSFVSASHPGGHGIYQFYDAQDPGYGARINRADALGRSSAWDWLAAQGYTLGLINIPMSHPPAELPGYQVTWPLERALRYCRPRPCCMNLPRRRRISSRTSPRCSAAAWDTWTRRNATSPPESARSGT